MKRNAFAAFLVNFLLTCLLSVGAMGAMVTGLSLPVTHPEWLYLSFCACALVGCILFLFKKGWIAAPVIAAVGLAYLWQEWYLSLSIRALITRLSWLYDSAYGWGILEFAGVNWRAEPLDLVIGAWGCLLALSAAGTTMGSRWLPLTLLLALLPAGATLVVTNTAPDPLYLYLLMLGLLLLLLTATVRRQDPRQGARLTVMTVLPVALLLGALFDCYPKDTYVNQSEEYLDSVVSWWQNATTLSFDNTGLITQTPATPNASATANLSRVGPRNTWGYTVMEVTADFSDTIYLRGQDFDTYDGTSWTATADRTEDFGLTFDWQNEGTITVRTSGATPSNVLYIPYYPTVEQLLTGGRLENNEDLLEYSFGVRSSMSVTRYLTPIAGAATESAGGTLNTSVNTGRYTNLPAATRRWAVAYLTEHFSTPLLNSSPDYEIANAIASHVRKSAVYDTDTSRMSGDYDDFAQWFLEESDTGYCVHFASAATVLLRAAGVPARYVTGYMFQTVEGETVEVTADQAHAWVEYFNENLGAWVVLEPTPADLREEETEPTETEATETEPPTQAPTRVESETRPDTERPGEAEEKLDLSWLWTALRWLLLPVAAWLAVLIQYTLRRNFRKVGRKPNARALAYWADMENLCRFTKQKPPEELEFLAEKAKFSQHTLTKEELNAFRAWLAVERKKLQEKPWYVRFVYRYVLALW